SIAKPRGLVNGDNLFVAEGEDRHQGLELEVFGKVASSLRVLGGLTWLDAEQKSTGSTLTDGKRVIGVPRVQGSFGSEWEGAGVEGFAIDGRVVYTGASYADGANTLKVPSWTRLDIGARYVVDLGTRAVTLRARVDNVTDRAYWASAGG